MCKKKKKYPGYLQFMLLFLLKITHEMKLVASHVRNTCLQHLQDKPRMELLNLLYKCW